MRANCYATAVVRRDQSRQYPTMVSMIGKRKDKNIVIIIIL